MAEPNQFCTFYVDDTLFGIEVLSVQEVLSYHDVTRVPLASSEVQGLINLRGQIIIAIDLRRRMNLPVRKDDKDFMLVITRVNEEVVGFLVDSVGDVLEVEDKSYEPVPSTVEGSTRELVSGVYKLEGKQLLMVLDATKVANLPDLKGTTT